MRIRPLIKGVRVLAVAVAAGAFLAACSSAGSNFRSLRQGLDQRGHYIAGVPFYKQAENACGPAALAAVSAFWGRPAVLERIGAAVYLPQLSGTLPLDMERYLQETGFQTHTSLGTLDELKTQVRENHPVIALLDLGVNRYRRPHYVTVVGFDDVNRVVIAHDGLNENNVFGYEMFTKAWRRAGNWMLVAVPGPLYNVRYAP